MLEIFTSEREKWSLKMFSSATQMGENYLLTKQEMFFIFKQIEIELIQFFLLIHRKEILKDVSFTVLPGQTLALVGL